MDLLMVRDRQRRALIPATDIDAERIKALPWDWPFQVQVTLTRTSKLNRWYRGILGKVADGMDANPQQLHNDLKLKAGLIEQVMLSAAVQGVVTIKLRSTSFPEMADDEFAAYCDFAVPAMFRDYVPHVKAEQQRRLIREWAGRRPKLEEPPKLFLPTL